jgi:hypothetical protein
MIAPAHALKVSAEAVRQAIIGALNLIDFTLLLLLILTDDWCFGCDLIERLAGGDRDVPIDSRSLAANRQRHDGDGQQAEDRHADHDAADNGSEGEEPDHVPVLI